MGKEGFLTPKEIAKRIKAKGLQKTRWFCQLCEKQCRDANGFKCHMESEGHLQQMRIFKDNSGKVMDSFSRDFEKGMMDIISRRFRTTRVHANVVYTEYIKDPYHVHMNSTRWVTLTAFAKYLGATGKCEIEESPKGFYLTYIERDPEVIARQEKREKMEVDDEERALADLEKRAKAAKELEMAQQKQPKNDVDNAETLITEAQTTGPISFAIQTKKKEISHPLVDLNAAAQPPAEQGVSGFDNEKPTKSEQTSDQPPTFTHTPTSTHTTTAFSHPSTSSNNNNDNGRQTFSDSVQQPLTKKRKAIEEIMAHQESQKEKKNRRDNWICEDIVVKILSKEFADGKYYKKKGIIRKVFDKYIALVKLPDSGDMIKIDQAELETVIPQPGGQVRIVNGAYRGEKATLISVVTERFSANVKLESGSHLGTTIEVPYEDLSKIAGAD